MLNKFTERGGSFPEGYFVGMRVDRGVERVKVGVIESKPNEERQMDTTNIDYYLFEDGRVSGKRYKEREAFWSNTSLWRSGYVPDHNQVYFKLMLYKNDQTSYDRTIADVKAVLPFLKDNKGAKRFGIFEHTLSEDGIYALDCYEDKFVLTFCRYGRKSELRNSETLEKAVSYIQEHHYYEDLLEDDD